MTKRSRILQTKLTACGFAMMLRGVAVLADAPTTSPQMESPAPPANIASPVSDGLPPQLPEAQTDSASQASARQVAPAAASAARATLTPAAVKPSPLPKEFSILQTRNPFAHGKPKGPVAGGPEATLVLKGVIESEGHYTAFIEDTAAKRVVEVATGNPIATGRVKTIDIDRIEYEVGGEIKRVEVGMNLNGQVAPPTPTTKPAAASPRPAPGPDAPGAMPPGATATPATRQPARATAGVQRAG